MYGLRRSSDNPQDEAVGQRPMILRVVLDQLTIDQRALHLSAPKGVGDKALNGVRRPQDRGGISGSRDASAVTDEVDLGHRIHGRGAYQSYMAQRDEIRERGEGSGA